MTRRTHKQQEKNIIKDALTQKLVGNKEVIILENAVDYVKKQGYIVVKPITFEDLEGLSK